MSELKLHPSLTNDVIVDAIERRESSLDNPGFCIACGLEHYRCEPDAREYDCESCNTPTVYAPEELIIMGLVGGVQ